MSSEEFVFSKTDGDHADGNPTLATFLNYHDQILDARNHQYNPWVQLLRVPFSPFYNRPILTFLLKYYRVHSTRDSLQYAISLLKTEDRTMELRAQKILYRILSLQNTDPTSPYYGVWPKYWEETISGISQPDLNWANFLGSYLLLVSLEYRQRLPSALITQVDKAVIHAAQAIQRRNVPLNYTNIAVLGIYVTLVAGETYGIDNLYEYGFTRLHQIHHDTIRQGMFTEYNSPVYGVTTLDAFGRLRLHVRDAQAKIWVEDLYRLAWKNIAHYFHWPTQQWAGPHSRNYSTLLKPYVLALIEQGTGGSIRFGLTEKVMLENQWEIPLPCPVDLESDFLQIREPCTRVKTIVNEKPQRRLTTYLTSDFTLGSVSYSDLWHQRHSLLAYWGTHETPGYLRLRFLCDGDDFAIAQFASVQKEGNVLAGLMFATDIDRRNPYVNCLSDQVLMIKDLRLRFELMGAATDFNRSTNMLGYLECCVEGVWVQLVMAYAQFDDWIGQWEVTQQSSKTYIDWVFFSGKRRTINLAKLGVAGMGLGIRLSCQYESIPPVKQLVKDKILTLKWYGLSLSFSVFPNSQAFLIQSISNDSI